jgi:predicted nucleic acid-binding protein
MSGPSPLAEGVVVDPSVIVDVLINGRSMPHTASLAAPAHMDAEVLSALGRLYRHGVLTAIDVEEMLDDLAAIPVKRVPIVALTGMAFALRHSVALRDGLYVALAQASDVALLTGDNRLARVCADQDLCTIA